MVALYLVIAFVVGYFLGNINFARIFTWNFSKKDITKVGSKNPGTMNVLRTQGFGRAMLTLAFEAIKVGVPALVCFFVFREYYAGFENLAYFLSSFGGILGHCFPVLYKFKGGKGVACTFGMFLFHPHFWWLSLVMFVICFLLLLFLEYGYVVSLLFIFTMSVYATCFFAINYVMWYIPLIIIVWLNFFLIVFLHRGNIKRTIHGTENKVDLREKLFKKHEKESVEVAKTVDEPNTSETKVEEVKDDKTNETLENESVVEAKTNIHASVNVEASFEEKKKKAKSTKKQNASDEKMKSDKGESEKTEDKENENDETTTS